MCRLLAVFLSCAACASAQTVAPHFEAASFKFSPPNAPHATHRDPGRVDFQGMNLQGLLWEAYRVWYYQIVWPPKRPTERYDVTATIPPGASKAEVRQMLQSLLAERLNLKFHRETREISVYAITIAKGGLRMKKADIDPDTEPESFPVGVHYTGQEKTIQGKMPVGLFPLMLAMDLDRPIVDMTGLKDAYEIDLQYTPMPPPGQPTQPSPEDAAGLRVTVAASLSSAMEKQLGLHMEVRKAPMEMLVIDHLDAAPTAN